MRTRHSHGMPLGAVIQAARYAVSDDLFDSNEFLVVGPLWFVAPFPRPHGTEETATAVTKVVTDSGSHAAVFTDLDLADRFLESIGSRERLKPFTLPDKWRFAEFLRLLQSLGETRLAFDPGEKHARVLPISRVIASIHR